MPPVPVLLDQLEKDILALTAKIAEVQVAMRQIREKIGELVVKLPAAKEIAAKFRARYQSLIEMDVLDLRVYQNALNILDTNDATVVQTFQELNLAQSQLRGAEKFLKYVEFELAALKKERSKWNQLIRLP